MLASILRRFGLAGTIAIVTLASVAASVAFTYVVMEAFTGGAARVGLVLAAVVPAACAPVFAWAQLRLVVQLQQAEAQLRRLSITDDLTGAYNRRYFLQMASQEVARASRYGTPFAVVLLDLDDFKALNDAYGHAGGDELLREVSGVCAATMRASDLFARLGGEEFVVLLPNTDAGGAAEIAERLRRRIAEREIRWNDESLRVTVSCGVCEFTAGPIDRLLACADQALYAAKRDGKNCTRLARADRAQSVTIEPVARA